MVINGQTKITGIIGYPVRHSLSPQMHNRAFQALGLNYCYVPMEVHPKDLKEAIFGLRALGFVGINVTVPHKEAVIGFLDELSEEAKFIGAVNTIKFEQGKMKGFNTDAEGFLTSLEEEKIVIKNKEVLLVGAGGAAKAVAFAIGNLCNKLYIYNRTREKAEAIAERLKNRAVAVEILSTAEVPETVTLVINATSLGLNQDDPLPFNVDSLQKHQIVYDLIYKETPLQKVVAQKGIRVYDGSGMLLWQAVAAFRIWTGKEPPVHVMRDALRKI